MRWLRIIPTVLHISRPRTAVPASFIRSFQTKIMDKISVSCCFDGGNIEFVSTSMGTPPEVRVKVKDDPHTELEKLHHKQWFYFRVSGVKTTEEVPAHKFVVVNAGDCSYPDAWTGYNVCASYDHKNWFRVPTDYDSDNGHLHWTMKVKSNQIYFAYFAPYSHERHLDLIGRCAALAANHCPTNLKNSSEVDVKSLGDTLDGRSIDLVTIGSGSRKIWFIARQHPGETMAEFFMEGVMERLLDQNDAVARLLRRDATFYCVPNMCPDGSFRGHLRTNACGANLNREWASSGDYKAPSLERSPEVFHVLAEMDRVGCDMCVDVHGDEALPYNFLSGSEGLPIWSDRLKHLQDTFSDAFKKASPDFQSEFGYDVDPPNEANLSMGSNQVGQRFDCLSFTFEMPFKDTAADPNPITGWSPVRSQRLGAAMLDAVAVVLPVLR